MGKYFHIILHISLYSKLKLEEKTIEDISCLLDEGNILLSFGCKSIKLSLDADISRQIQIPFSIPAMSQHIQHNIYFSKRVCGIRTVSFSTNRKQLLLRWSANSGMTVRSVPQRGDHQCNNHTRNDHQVVRNDNSQIVKISVFGKQNAGNTSLHAESCHLIHVVENIPIGDFVTLCL